DRLDGVGTELDELPAFQRLFHADAAVELSVLGDVRERVDVGADVGPHGNHVVGCGPAVGADHVPVPARHGVPVRRVVGGLGHAYGEAATQVDDPNSRTDDGQQGILGGHLLLGEIDWRMSQGSVHDLPGA